jgi:hypothetical protein
MKVKKIFISLWDDLNKINNPCYLYPIFLLLIAFITYGIFISALGFYGDDLTLAWLAYKVGSVDSFFLNIQNRPLWGQLFLYLTKIISPQPWQWQVYIISIRWLVATEIFFIFRSMRSIDQRISYYVSLLFLIYPGALIYYQPLTFSIHFLALLFLFSSFLLNMISLQNNKWRTHLRLASLFLSMLNLTLTEYFYFLELVRPFFIYLGLKDKEPKQKNKLAAAEYIPYFILFLAISIYRYFFQTSIVHYQPILIQGLQSSPINTIVKFLPNAINDMFRFGLVVWMNTFQQWSNLMQQGRTTTILVVLLVLISFIVIYGFYYKFINRFLVKNKSSIIGVFFLLTIGLFALFLGGLPPWIAGLETSIDRTITNRFSMGFALGSAMFVAGLLGLFPKSSKIPFIVLAAICSFSIGTHAINANLFRYGWIEQKRFFWQMVWRFPSLPSPTTIISDQSISKMAGENSLSAGINWIYFHESYGKTQNQAGYYLFYDEAKVKVGLNDLNKPLPPMKTGLLGQSSYEDYHLLTVENSGGCMLVLDPMLASLDPNLPEYLKRGAALSDLNFSFNEDLSHTAIMDSQIFGAEPPHDWCYYMEKADLAKSKGEWGEMLRLKAAAEHEGFSPEQPQQKLLFLYAYLRSGDIQQALSYTREISKSSEGYRPTICKIWAQFTPGTNITMKQQFDLLKNELACNG